MKAAILDANRVLFIEHETLYGMRGEVPEAKGPITFSTSARRLYGARATT